MIPRREFNKPTRVAIIKRATDADGTIRCESCLVATARFEIDHTIPDALQVDKSRKLTADDGRLLCVDCHGRKTPQDVRVIAKAKRVEARHVGADRSRGPLAGPDAATRADRREARSRDRRGERLAVPAVRMPRGYVTATERG